MTAARGIIHSEMPQQSEGRMRGFQLWLNLPASEKMKPVGYRDIAAADVPTVQLAGGVEVRVIAGTLNDGERRIHSTVSTQTARASPDSMSFALHLPDNADFEYTGSDDCADRQAEAAVREQLVSKD